MCVVRAIARDVYKVNVSVFVQKQLNNIQVHVETFYRYATFQKYPIERWESLCDFLSGRGNPILLKIMFANVGKYIQVKHPCPYKLNETISILIERYDIRSFRFEPLLPAGDYRLNVTFAEGKERHTIFVIEASGSVSDHRIWH